jgi:hypothetical protein
MLRDFFLFPFIPLISYLFSNTFNLWSVLHNETLEFCEANSGKMKHWSESLESLAVHPDQSQKLGPNMLQWVNRYDCTREFMACRRTTYKYVYRQFTALPCFLYTWTNVWSVSTAWGLEITYSRRRYILFSASYGQILRHVYILCLKINTVIICVIFGMFNCRGRRGREHARYFAPTVDVLDF